MAENDAIKLLILSGLSGSGKRTALHALEDIGLFCTDNLPLDMLPMWIKHVADLKRPMAVCLDVRSSANVEKLHQTIQAARLHHKHWRLVFLETSDEVLLRRFSTVKRHHPFNPEDDLLQSIRAERHALGDLRDAANLVLDTSHLNPYELASLIEDFWKKTFTGDPSELMISLVSFSYQHGLPQDADMVIDVRYLTNPHYQPELRALTGRDEAVKDFFFQQTDIIETANRLQDWLQFLLPRLERERKRYFTLALGCSGGRHRSVYLVEWLASWMREQGMTNPWVRHRELSP
ncbi:MAG: RNase adapter RapZ [Mariprofundaceae bacterium]